MNRLRIGLAGFFALGAVVLAPPAPVLASNALAEAGVQPGNITIALKKIVNLRPYDKMILDMIPGGDGRFYFSTLNGKILALNPASGNISLFLDLGRNGAKLPMYFGNGANGLYGFAFHPDFVKPDKPGFHKIYTWADEQLTAGTNSNLPNGLPDFWHPENFIPLTAKPTPQNVRNARYTFYNTLREWTVNTTVSPPVVDPASSRVLIRVGAPGPDGHNGAPPRFGPDGLLYFSLGDGGGNGNDFKTSANNPSDGHTNGTGNAQDLTSIFGKVIRIDPNPENKDGILSTNKQYRIPADNPFASDTAGKVREIYAFGFRNPWKLTFDAASGKLYVADVGQHHREEFDVVEKGGNYGWGYLEGSMPLVTSDYANAAAASGEDSRARTIVTARTPPGGYANFKSLPPLAEYRTRRQFADGKPMTPANLIGDGTSATIGYVYHGTAIPALVGQLVGGDYSVGDTPMGNRPAQTARLFYLNPAVPDPVIFEFQYASGSKINAQLLGFGEDPKGELYVLFDNGEVDQIVAP